MGAIADRLLDVAAARGPRLLGGRIREEPGLGPNPRFRPHLNSRRFAWAHYGMMIPDLPEPHRFFSIMSLVGATGSRAFDTDHAWVDSPRNTATAVYGTAASSPGFFRAWSIPRECKMSEGGEEIRFGEEIEISGTYPNLDVKARGEGFDAEFALTLTEASTHFTRSPGYVHLSVLSHYAGEIDWEGSTVPVAGTCTFEHAACVGPYLLRDRPLPFERKVPLDFFTYQVVNVDGETQLLLGVTRALGRPLIEAIYLRSTRRAPRRADSGVRFEVLERQEEPAVAPDGAETRLPRLMRWTTPRGAPIVLELTCEVDTPMTYGLGTGYVGGFSHEGTLDGVEISGRGYVEYVDRQTSA